MKRKANANHCIAWAARHHGSPPQGCGVTTPGTRGLVLDVKLPPMRVLQKAGAPLGRWLG